MPKLTPAQRRMRGKIAANTRWANTDSESRLAVTKPGRDAFEQRFADQVDPERKLTEAERAKLVRNAKAVYYQQLSFKRSRARQARNAAERESQRAREFDDDAEGIA